MLVQSFLAHCRVSAVGGELDISVVSNSLAYLITDLLAACWGSVRQHGVHVTDGVVYILLLYMYILSFEIKCTAVLQSVSLWRLQSSC